MSRTKPDLAPRQQAKRSGTARLLGAVGQGAAQAGAFAGRLAQQAGEGILASVRGIDPDVGRHVAQLPLLGLTLLAPGRAPVEPLPEDGHPPVVFVHGLGGHRGNFLPIRTFFRLLGRSRTYSVGFSPGADLEAMAGELARYVAEVLEINDLREDRRVDLVAHSMGGLVARLACDDPATARRVGTLVTLGTPHQGTYAARFAHTAAIRALRPDSPLMQRLSRQLPWAGPPRLVAFWSESDLFILPPAFATLEGAESVELDGFTHYGYLLHPRGFRQVFARLAGG